MHMCDELAAFGRQPTCMRSRIGRRTNGPVRHTCQHGSAVVETISQCSSSLCKRCRRRLKVANALGKRTGLSTRASPLRSTDAETFWTGRKRSQGRAVMANSSRQIAEPFLASKSDLLTSEVWRPCTAGEVRSKCLLSCIFSRAHEREAAESPRSDE
jgi:hypothetical protein